MNDERLLSRLDLNLLVALDALLTERNVTRAAERLRLSQPSLSGSLARLRVHFDDPLLARRGNRYELTPLAMRLVEHTSAAISAVARVFESQARWNPEESTREFTIHGSDYAIAVIAPHITRLAAVEAPGVRFRFVPTSTQATDGLMARLASIDAVILPHGVASNRPNTELWRDDWLILAAAEHRRVPDAFTMRDLQHADWVFTYQAPASFTTVGRQLEQLGMEPQVRTVVESFALLPLFVSGTDRLALIQRRLVPLVAHAGVDVHELPFEPTPVIEALWWHPTHDSDPEHEWFRGLLARAAASLG
ncbi:MAG: LysR family transcriptional regulator [Pseudoclavibacter sp.]